MDTIQMLQKNVENIQSDVKDVNRKLDEVHKRLIDYDSRWYKCSLDFDVRYVKLCEFQHLYKSEQEKHNSRKLSNFHKGTELIKNIMEIVHAISPFVISYIAYLLIKG